MYQFEAWCSSFGAGYFFLDNLEVPELRGLVSTTTDHRFAIGMDVQRPDWSIVRLDRIQQSRGCNVKNFQFAVLITDYNDLVTREKGRAQGIAAFQCTQTALRTNVPNLQAAVGGRSQHSVVGTQGNRSDVGTVTRDVNSQVAIVVGAIIILLFIRSGDAVRFQLVVRSRSQKLEVARSFCSNPVEGTDLAASANNDVRNKDFSDRRRRNIVDLLIINFCHRPFPLGFFLLSSLTLPGQALLYLRR
ncbi:conserved hypothetical protein [Aspergillus fumigatus A1163]|uniref:Uncharacterized protein n=1 Tax=Aspergillus fumigatus (strain CBS 144.89 / FGSC A1163 / CEA10) TaxID=451804 RepID=B0XMK6_ASPFC|nr:conserved hypothetical protein [Aspergillus fumigatus A1163]